MSPACAPLSATDAPPRERLWLRMLRDGNFLLTMDHGSLTRKFCSLFQAVQFAQTLSSHGSLRLTIVDASGREIVETFV